MNEHAECEVCGKTLQFDRDILTGRVMRRCRCGSGVLTSPAVRPEPPKLLARVKTALGTCMVCGSQYITRAKRPRVTCGDPRCYAEHHSRMNKIRKKAGKSAVKESHSWRPDRAAAAKRKAI